MAYGGGTAANPLCFRGSFGRAAQIHCVFRDRGGRGSGAATARQKGAPHSVRAQDTSGAQRPRGETVRQKGAK